MDGSFWLLTAGFFLIFAGVGGAAAVFVFLRAKQREERYDANFHHMTEEQDTSAPDSGREAA